jgi:hypothetical protein
MVQESGEKIKLLDDYMEMLKHDLLFSMAERKLRPESTKYHRIITIKGELDKAAQERMKLSQIHYGSINDRIPLSLISA